MRHTCTMNVCSSFLGKVCSGTASELLLLLHQAWGVGRGGGGQ